MMKALQNFLFAILVFAELLIGASGAIAANWEWSPPAGEAIKGKIINQVYHGIVSERWVWTNHCLFLYSYSTQTKKWEFTSTQYCAPKDIQIAYVMRVIKNGRENLLIVLSDGTVVSYHVPATEETLGKINLDANESPKKLLGDALYTLTNLNIYVSRDTAKTWALDTSGLSGTARDIAVDSSQFVYAITSYGFFRQHPDSNIWRAMTLPTLATWNKIFIDRKNTIYLGGAFSGQSVVYQSTNLGATWSADTAGLGGQSIYGFGDDAFGNVYAITSDGYASTGGNKLFRFNGTKWNRIDASIGAAIDSLNQQQIFTDVGGDSVIVATSIYGTFSSNDQGATWTESNDSIGADYAYGLVRTRTNRLVTTTNLGVFSKNQNDTSWQKTYPQNGYLGGQPLFVDDNDAIYTLGPLNTKPDFSGNPYPPRITMKSADGGLSWQPDTLGLAMLDTVAIYLFYVDETGTQHLASYGTGAAPSTIYVKLPGQAWASDAGGFATNHFAPQAFGSDRKGSLWMSLGADTLPTLWRRNITGGVWSADTQGLHSALLNSFAAAKNNIVYAGAFDGVYRKSGSGWTKLPPPGNLSTTTPAYSISIDSTGALIAGFQHFDANYNSIGDGVFSTTDDGAHWTNLNNIDTTTFRQFVSYGDTTYGLSYYDGVFLFGSGPSAVHEVPVELNLINVYPNPLVDATHISIALSEPGMLTLSVYDMLGRKVQTLAHDVMNTGAQPFTWDAHGMAPGIYWCEIQQNGRVERRPLVLER